MEQRGWPDQAPARRSLKGKTVELLGFLLIIVFFLLPIASWYLVLEHRAKAKAQKDLDDLAEVQAKRLRGTKTPKV